MGAAGNRSRLAVAPMVMAAAARLTMIVATIVLIIFAALPP